jgi:hypothetical protein
MTDNEVGSLPFDNASKRRQNTEVKASALRDNFQVEALLPRRAYKSISRSAAVGAPFKRY